MILRTFLSLIRNNIRTSIAFAALVLAVVPLTIAQLIVPRERIPSELVYKTNSRCVLFTDNLPDEIVLKRGEEVKVLGYVEGDNFNPHQLWVETSGGNRGYLPVEIIDNKAIVYPNVRSRKDSSRIAVQHKGDVVTMTGWKKSFSSYTVLLPDGRSAEITQENLRSPFVEKLRKYVVRRDGEGWRPMSESKFRSIVMTRSLTQMETSSYPPHFISKDRQSARAIYPVRVFQNGKFYSPVVSYDASGKPVHYRFPEKALTENNSWLLRMIPFYGRICDFGFVWPLWTKGVYDTGIQTKVENWQANAKLTDTSILWYWIVNIFFFLPLILAVRFLPAFLLPLLGFCLLCIPRIWKRVGQRCRIVRILKVFALVMTVLWCVVALVDYSMPSLVLGSLMAFWLFCLIVNTLEAPITDSPEMPSSLDCTSPTETPDYHTEDPDCHTER